MRFAVVVGLLTALRLYVMTQVPLTGDEAYYWQWSQHLALGYYDHPPMVGWVIAMFTWIFGTSVFSARLAGPLSSAVTALIVYRLAREISEQQRVALLAGSLVLTAPLLSVGALAITPDTLLLPAWAACVLLLYRALFEDNRRAWWWAGVVLGIGILSKFTAFLLIPLLFAFLGTSPTHRQWLRRREPYVFVLIGTAVASPLFWWNATHGWQTFVYQATLRLGHVELAGPPGVRHLADFLVQQAIMQSPVVFALAVFVVVRGLMGAGRDPRPVFLATFGGGIVACFTLMSLYAPVRGHWPIAGYPILMIAIAWWHFRLGTPYRATVIAGLIVAVATTSAAYAVLVRPQILFDFVSAYAVKNRTVNQGNTLRAENLAEIFGYEGAAEYLRGVVAEMNEQGPTFVVTDSYALSSVLAFYSGIETHVLGGSVMGRAYAEWDRFDTLAGRDGVFVDLAPYGARRGIVALLSGACQRVEGDPPVRLFVGVQPIRPFYFIRCYGFRPAGVDVRPR
ncbi:MAG TPA: glycosyltransferase family 39 protein [Vicinamibacterales bacterium]|nr:glycosyltransferase family 39 protein [Vicinamibacterales bacterium]